MTDLPIGRRLAYRNAIEQFIRERLDARLAKLTDDDPKRDALVAQHQTEIWLADAARRVQQIRAVTHTLKPIHPDARGSNLYRSPDTLPARAEIGSQVLGTDFTGDVVGNAAALDVYKLLKLDLDGKSLLQRLLAYEPELVAALCDDAAQASAWAEAFRGLVQSDSDAFASHALAKQLYWLQGVDPTDKDFILLAPLYASSLAHAVYARLTEDRFGDQAKAARQAHRDGVAHPQGHCEYPGLAVQKFGGTKPQNISQLNSERRGENYLLASLPPRWTSRAVRAPWFAESVFASRFARRDAVRSGVAGLRRFLLSDPPRNVATRVRVESVLDELIGELVELAAEFHGGLSAGWSLHPNCRLVEVECLWLDPWRSQMEGQEAFAEAWQAMDWPGEIGRRFGNWLNHALGDKLALGDVEQRQWRNELLLDEGEDGWAWSLRQQQQRLGVPHSGPMRRAWP